MRTGDWVEVCSQEEILATLDESGRLDGMPFMPEMLAFCGQRVRVQSVAHKTCDTIEKSGGRSVSDCVHLDDLRCDGQAHGGCEAGCLLFWKTAWLRKADSRGPVTTAGKQRQGPSSGAGRLCSREALNEQTQRLTDAPDEEASYVCQATELLKASRPLSAWDVRQYVRDITTGNASLFRVLKGLLISGYWKVENAGVGLGRLLRWLFNLSHRLFGTIPYPWRHGTIPVGRPTPKCDLNLGPDETVRVKTYPEILATLDTHNKNRGLYFGVEEVPYCGTEQRVLRRVHQIIDEKTGRMIRFKTPAVILDNVYCRADYCDRRLFCPRRIYTYWREAWLERADVPPPVDKQAQSE